MNRLTLFAVTAAAALVIAIIGLPSASAQQADAVNRGVVELETTGSTGISVKIAEDLARLIDDGATRRLVPVVGKNSLQNLIDLRYLRGVDLAIVESDVLEYARDQRMVPGIESSVSYITKLYNEEFHLLVGPKIKTIGDLTNKKVNVDLQGSVTSIVAAKFFNSLNLAAAATNDPQDVALEKLLKGQIDGLAFIAGKPAPLFATVRRDTGIHFLSIPYDKPVGSYLPTRLTNAEYPSLILQDQPVETIAVGTLLLAADLRQVPERYRNVANFVEMFFSGFQTLLEPGDHPKWHEVNLATEFEGWRRYVPAQQWLQRNNQIVTAQSSNNLKSMFDRFIDERRQASGGAPMSQEEKNALFQQFESWRGSLPR